MPPTAVLRGGETYVHAAVPGSQEAPRVVELSDGTLAIAFTDSSAGLVVSLDGVAAVQNGIGALWWDADGTGPNEAVQLALLLGAPTLTEDHFDLI